MTETDFITRTMFDLADVLAVDPLFSDNNIQILCEDARTSNDDETTSPTGAEWLYNTLEAALQPLQSKGISVFIPFPALAVMNAENIPGPYLNDATYNALIMENIAVNRFGTGTKIRAAVFARQCARIWHLFCPMEGHSLKVKTIRAIRANDFPPHIAQVLREYKFAGWNVSAKMELPDNGYTDKVDTPLITVAAGQVTLTCSTANATMYYSIDGTFPKSTTGTQYTAPFSSPSNCVLRVVGYLTDKISSDCANLVFE